MKIKLLEILEAHSCLKTIIDDTQLHVDALCKFKLLGLLKSLDPYADNFDTVRNEKILEFGKYDDEKNTAFIDKDDTEALEKFNHAINELLNSETDISVKYLKPADIIDKGIPAGYLTGIYNLIKEEEQ